MSLNLRITFLSVLLFLLFCSDASSAEKYGNLNGCGRYKIGGLIRKTPEGVRLVVFEKTASEVKLTPASGELHKFFSYTEIPVTLTATIIKIDGTKGEVSAPENIRPVAPDPLNPIVYSGFQLIKNEKCEK